MAAIIHDNYDDYDKRYLAYQIFHLGHIAGIVTAKHDDPSTLERREKEFYSNIGFEDVNEFVSVYPGNCMTQSSLMELSNSAIGRQYASQENRIDKSWVLCVKEIGDPLDTPEYLLHQLREPYPREDIFIILPTIEDMRLIDEYKPVQEDGIVIPDEELWFCSDWKE